MVDVAESVKPCLPWVDLRAGERQSATENREPR